MKKAYGQLYELNRELIMGYCIRSNNHMELLDCLKIVNQAVQKAAKLRGLQGWPSHYCNLWVAYKFILSYPPTHPHTHTHTSLVGKPKAQVVAACRAAIKSSDVDSLLRVIKTGAA